MYPPLDTDYHSCNLLKYKENIQLPPEKWLPNNNH